MRAPLLAAVCIALAAGRGVAQAHRVPFGEGTHAFRAVLKKEGMKPLADPLTLARNPATSVLIVLGQPDILDPLCRDGILQRFLQGGGAALIATDRATPASLRTAFNVRVAGEIVGADPAVCWNELPACPFVQELRPANQARHPVFQGLSDPLRLATNNPSYLTDVFPPVIAELPIQGVAYVRWNGRRLFQQLRFACAREFGRGRLLVLADHSIFINDMMLQPDNDNIAFAFNAIRWLDDAGNGKRRTEVLFYEDGRIRTEFNVSLDYPQPAIPPLVPLADEIVVGLERENAFNNTLLDMTGGPGPILRTIAGLLTAVLLLFGLYRFLQGRYRPEGRVPRLPGQLDALTAALPAVERRHQAVIAQGNLAEAARELAHQAFAAVGLTPTAEAPPPAVSVTGWWPPFRARRWGREVRALWKLAVRGPGHRVSPAALRRLGVTLHNLLAAIAAGQVRLAAANSAI
jgi:hypothetical protein